MSRAKAVWRKHHILHKEITLQLNVAFWPILKFSNKKINTWQIIICQCYDGINHVSCIVWVMTKIFSSILTRPWLPELTGSAYTCVVILEYIFLKRHLTKSHWTHPLLRQRRYHNVRIGNYQVVPQQFKLTVPPPQAVGGWVMAFSDCIHWPLKNGPQ